MLIPTLRHISKSFVVLSKQKSDMIEKGNKKTIRAWVMYDWANSVYPLIISSAIFPILYEVNTSIKDPVSGKTTYDIISFLGIEFKN
jgi:UMF1 family MFS transporter